MNPNCDHIFTDYSETDGYIGIGKVPVDIQTQLEELRILSNDPTKQMTYHIWYDHFPERIKQIVHSIQKNPFWNRLCTRKNALGTCDTTCILTNVQSMDELYISKVPNDKTRDQFLYGASGNYDLHIDSIFRFPYIRFYRILIGLTDGNTTVETYFPNFKKGVFLNKNDYILFDFDRTQHQVINHSKTNSQERAMLKLHFCVSELPNETYLNMVSAFYNIYEKITRYVMEKGTEPESFYEFFLGLICVLRVQLPYLLNLYVILILITLVFYQKPISKKILLPIVMGIFLLYLYVVFLFWLRYTLKGVR
jgi:hypothetical protein